MQQLRPLFIGDGFGIDLHRLDHARPVGDGIAHIGERGFDGLQQGAALAGIDARRLDVDHRFPMGALGADFGNGNQRALRVALDRQHRVGERVDHQPGLGNRRGHRVDQKRHVVVDQGNAEQTALFTGRRHLDHGLAGLADLSGGQQKTGGFLDPLRICGTIPGKHRVLDALFYGRLKRGGGAPTFLREVGGQSVSTHCSLRDPLHPPNPWHGAVTCPLLPDGGE